MTVAEVIPLAFLLVAVLGFGVQMWGLLSLAHKTETYGLVRTAGCRVACAVVYVFVGANALWAQWAVLQVTFGSFCVTQLIWQVNAALDVRHSRAVAREVRRTGLFSGL